MKVSSKTHLLRHTDPLPLIPRNSLLKLNRISSEDIQRTANSQIHPAATQLLHQLQVLQMPTAARVSDRDSANGRQEFDKLSVDTSLLSFNISSMDEEFGAVRFKKRDVFCWCLSQS